MSRFEKDDLNETAVRYVAIKTILSRRNVDEIEMGEAMRERVRELLLRSANADLVDSDSTVPEMAVSHLQAQYSERLDTLRRFGFLKEGKEGEVPSPEEIRESFTPEELMLAATSFQKPMLFLIPETSFRAKIRAIDEFSGMRLQSTQVHEFYQDPEDVSDEVAGWRSAIVDAHPEIQPYPGDKPDVLCNHDRIANRRLRRHPAEKGMDRHIYAMMAMEAIKHGELMDMEEHTLLDDEPEVSKNRVACAETWPSAERGMEQLAFDVVESRDPAAAFGRLRSVVGYRLVKKAQPTDPEDTR